MNESIKVVTARLYALRNMEHQVKGSLTHIKEAIIKEKETIGTLEKDNFGVGQALEEAKLRLESAAASIECDMGHYSLELLHIMSTHMEKIGKLTRNRK